MGKVRVDVASARWEPWLLSTLLFVEKATEVCQSMILAYTAMVTQASFFFSSAAGLAEMRRLD